MRRSLAFLPAALFAASLACNKTPDAAPKSPAPVPPAAPAAEKPAATPAEAAPAADQAAAAPNTAGGTVADAPKPGCGPDCKCKDHAACGEGKCEGCAGHEPGKCEGCAGKAGEAASACGGEAAKAPDGAEAAPSGCGGMAAAEAPAPAAPAPAAPSGAVAHFGEPFTSAADAAMPIDDLFAKAGDFNGKTVKISATVSKVCKKKGCWFVLEGTKGDGTYARVTLKDYSFFVPTDCDGKKAVVEGVFKTVEVPEAARKHLAEDGKEDPTKIQGPAMEMSVVATAVDIQS